MPTIGYTHGRFQPFHKGHLPILLYVLEKYDELWVGISNPLRRLPDNIDTYDPALQASIKEGRKESKNIFTFLERKEMIIETLRDAGVDLGRVSIYPHFGFYEEKNWADFMPPQELTTIVIHVKDVHHDEKVDNYEKHGWKVEKVPLLEDGYSGTKFHEAFPNGNWQGMVPAGTKRVIERKLQ